MPHELPQAVLITGPVGVGKTSLAAELGDVLAERGTVAAVVDLDWLGWLPSAVNGSIDALILRNLEAVWPNFRDAGAERLVLARSVRDAQLVTKLREAYDLQVVRLRASEETVAARLAGRDTGAQLEEHLAERTEEADVADFEFANDGPPIRDVAEELLRRLAWA